MSRRHLIDVIGIGPIQKVMGTELSIRGLFGHVIASSGGKERWVIRGAAKGISALVAALVRQKPGAGGSGRNKVVKMDVKQSALRAPMPFKPITPKARVGVRQRRAKTMPQPLIAAITASPK